MWSNIKQCKLARKNEGNPALLYPPQSPTRILNAPESSLNQCFSTIMQQYPGQTEVGGGGGPLRRNHFCLRTAYTGGRGLGCRTGCPPCAPDNGLVWGSMEIRGNNAIHIYGTSWKFMNIGDCTHWLLLMIPDYCWFNYIADYYYYYY